MANARREFEEHVRGRRVLCASLAYGKIWREDDRVAYTLCAGYTPEQYAQFLASLDFEYDSGYGGQELFGTIWYADGTWSDRGVEDNGSEWWEHNECPPAPGGHRGVPVTQAPAGYALVPVKLTEAMKTAGGHANSEWLNDSAPLGEARYARPMESVWHAMLAAAPAAEKAGDLSGVHALRDALTAVDDQLVAILNGADGSVYNKLKAARDDLVRIWLPLARPAAAAGLPAAERAGAYPLSEYEPGQWWLAELENLFKGGEFTLDTKRAVGVALNFANAYFTVPATGEWGQAQISAAGRALADLSAISCGVDKEDNWKVYSEEFMEEARAALDAAARARP